MWKSVFLASGTTSYQGYYICEAIESLVLRWIYSGKDTCLVGLLIGHFFCKSFDTKFRVASKQMTRWNDRSQVFLRPPALLHRHRMVAVLRGSTVGHNKLVSRQAKWGSRKYQIKRDTRHLSLLVHLPCYVVSKAILVTGLLCFVKSRTTLDVPVKSGCQTILILFIFLCCKIILLQ